MFGNQFRTAAVVLNEVERQQAEIEKLEERLAILERELHLLSQKQGP